MLKKKSGVHKKRHKHNGKAKNKAKTKSVKWAKQQSWAADRLIGRADEGMAQERMDLSRCFAVCCMNVLSRYFLLFRDQATNAKVIVATAASWPIGQVVGDSSTINVFAGGWVGSCWWWCRWIFCPLRQWHWPQSQTQESRHFACKKRIFSYTHVYTSTHICQVLECMCVPVLLHIDQSLALSGIHILLIPPYWALWPAANSLTRTSELLIVNCQPPDGQPPTMTTKATICHMISDQPANAANKQPSFSLAFLIYFLYLLSFAFFSVATNCLFFSDCFLGLLFFKAHFILFADIKNLINILCTWLVFNPAMISRQSHIAHCTFRIETFDHAFALLPNSTLCPPLLLLTCITYYFITLYAFWVICPVNFAVKRKMFLGPSSLACHSAGRTARTTRTGVCEYETRITW